ncbi:TetR/AcrR family transcriptional regulator [Nocardioides limicola]|uniref:TetR/AcrR family transcriptional regulator n=1 Tax=Nocardioides limicola TaxID=2803368 RepID=UPI00193BB2DC|nr:TetR/AcrR family transcriptional regulator [Nocardioides sp. DJM-14]
MARPRDPLVDTRILHATRRLLERDGIEHLTMEAIAAEANVGKPAIYRRYANKDEIVLSLNIADSVPQGEVDTGSFAGDIRVLTDELIVSLKRMPRNVIGPQLGMAIADEESGTKFLSNMAHPGMALMTQMWDRGIRRGEVDPDLDFLAAKVALGTSVIFAILLYRLDPDGPALRQIVDQWIAGVRPPRTEG